MDSWRTCFLISDTRGDVEEWNCGIEQTGAVVSRPVVRRHALAISKVHSAKQARLPGSSGLARTHPASRFGYGSVKERIAANGHKDHTRSSIVSRIQEKRYVFFLTLGAVSYVEFGRGIDTDMSAGAIPRPSRYPDWGDRHRKSSFINPIINWVINWIVGGSEA